MVVKKIKSSRRHGKSKRRFSIFHFPNACKIELQTFREASTFIRVDGEMQWLPAYFDNPILVHFNELVVSLLYLLFCF